MSTIEKIQEEVLVEEAVGVNGEFNQEALKEKYFAEKVDNFRIFIKNKLKN